MRRKLLISAVVLAFGVLFSIFVLSLVQLPLIVVAALVFLVPLHVGVLSLGYLREAPRDRAPGRGLIWLFALALMVTVPFAFMLEAFGTNDVGSLLITINENQMGDMVAVGLEGFLPEIAFYGGLIALCLLGAGLMQRHMGGGRATLMVLTLLLLGFGPLSHFVYRTLVPSPAHALVNPEQSRQGPHILARPERQKNVIFVYMESVERSYREIPRAQEAFAPLAAIEDRGLSFRNLRQAEGTGSTVGGLVGTQCGVPLLPRGVFNIHTKIEDKLERMPDTPEFMTHVPCLGDVLSADGYTASYINGSDLTIFSKGDFFRSHGFSRVKGLKSWPGWEDEPRTSIWGMDDDLLFERVTDELRHLAGQDAPFLLATLTLATHGPGGYPDKACAVDDPGQETALMLAAIRCTGAHVQRLIDEVEALGIADETLIVVLNDHFAFRNTLEEDLRQTERRNFLTILGAGQGVNTRAGTMLDVYPTVLELLGYELKDSRAGLGQSLLADTPTFVEREGLGTLNAAIQYNTALQAALWHADEG